MTDERRDLGPFHEVGNLFPDETAVLTATPETHVLEALRIMIERRYSQLPVMDEGQVRGVFSLWSLAKQLASSPDVALRGLLVEDVMEKLPLVTVEDSLHTILDSLRQYEAVLVVSPQGLQAIATPMDVLDYFYHVARPFVLLGEIELSLRDLILVCVPGDLLQQCVERSIAKVYKDRNQPTPLAVAGMTFEDYRMIITARENWPLFEGTLGRNRELVQSKLERIRKIRNDVFHFRNNTTVLDHETLASTRDWLLDKARKARPGGRR